MHIFTYTVDIIILLFIFITIWFGPLVPFDVISWKASIHSKFQQIRAPRRNLSLRLYERHLVACLATWLGIHTKLAVATFLHIMYVYVCMYMDIYVYIYTYTCTTLCLKFAYKFVCIRYVLNSFHICNWGGCGYRRHRVCLHRVELNFLRHKMIQHLSWSGPLKKCLEIWDDHGFIPWSSPESPV